MKAKSKNKWFSLSLETIFVAIGVVALATAHSAFARPNPYDTVTINVINGLLPQEIVVGAGDFDGDGIHDLVVHDATSGFIRIFPNGDHTLAYRLNAPHEPNAYVLGVVDITGNGFPDILWYDSVWRRPFMWKISHGNYIGSAYYGESYWSDWEFIGFGQFGERKGKDTVWYQPSTGYTKVSYAMGTGVQSFYITPFPNIPSTFGWKPVGVVDFNADGMTDVLWHNNLDDSIIASFHHGKTVIGTTNLPLTWSGDTVFAGFTKIPATIGSYGVNTLWQMQRGGHFLVYRFDIHLGSFIKDSGYEHHLRKAALELIGTDSLDRWRILPIEGLDGDTMYLIPK